MALKFGRSTVKTTDPQGNRIADPEVVGRVIPEGKVSSWPEVRKMYKLGAFGEEGKNANFGPEVMKYLSGEVNTLSDVEFEEPILSRIPREGGGTRPALQAFLKPGGKAYAAMEAKTKRKPVTAGKINQYSTNQYGAGNDLMVGETTDLGTFRKKTEPLQKKVEPIQEKVELIPEPPIQKPVVVDNTDNFEPVEKMVPLKPTKITEKKLGKLRQAKEDLTWDPPKFVKEKGVRVPMTKLKKGGKSGIQGAHSKVVGGIKGSSIKYNTEKRQSAAYYGDSTWSTGEPITGKTESELRQLKKETRGEFGRMLKEGRLGDALTTGKDLSQIRKATRYAKNADLAVDSKTGLTIEGQGSNLRYFTPERTKIVNENGKLSQDKGAMAGYKEFQTQEKGKAFRAQYENATNRNTIANQLKTKKK